MSSTFNELVRKDWENKIIAHDVVQYNIELAETKLNGT